MKSRSENLIGWVVENIDTGAVLNTYEIPQAVVPPNPGDGFIDNGGQADGEYYVVSRRFMVSGTEDEPTLDFNWVLYVRELTRNV